MSFFGVSLESSDESGILAAAWSVSGTKSSSLPSSVSNDGSKFSKSFTISIMASSSNRSSAIFFVKLSSLDFASVSGGGFSECSVGGDGVVVVVGCVLGLGWS